MQHDEIAIAWKCFREGSPRRAEQIARQLRRSQPENPEVYFLLGAICLEGKRPEESVKYFRQTVELKDEFPEAHNNLGNAYAAIDKLHSAVPCYRRALELREQYPEASNNLGNALRQLGKLEEAKECFEHALKSKQDYPEAYNNLGLVLRATGKPQEAAHCFREALKYRPDYPEASNNLGIVYAIDHNIDEAIACFEMAVARRPDYVDALSNLGIAYMEGHHLEQAERAFEKLLTIVPRSSSAHLNMGKCLAARGLHQDALESFSHARQLDDHFPELHHYAGESLRHLGQFRSALECYERAATMAPHFADAHFGRGLALSAMGDDNGAIAAYAEAHALSPALIDAQVNASKLLIKRGDFQKGWEQLYSLAKSPTGITHVPRWHGQPLADRTILVDACGDSSDLIHFIHYAGQLKDSRATVIVRCNKPLTDLLRCCPAVDLVLDESSIIPQLDYWVPILGLPHAFGSDIDSFPYSSATFQLPVQKEPVTEHESPSTPHTLNIGFCPRPASDNAVSRLNSIPSAYFTILTNCSNISLAPLRIDNSEPAVDGDFDTDSRTVHDNEGQRLLAVSSELADLDLVVTCDCEIAHLAGSLDKKVWLLLPSVADWRWLEERCDCPWYPNMTIFRQKRSNDWISVFKDLGRHLTTVFPDRVTNSPFDLSDQEYAQLNCEIGKELVSAPNADCAIEHFRRAIVLDPKCTSAYITLGGVLRRSGKLEAAIENYEMAIHIAPDHPEAHNSLGIAVAAKGRHSEAIDCFQRAVKLDPDYAHAHNNLGVAYLDMGHLDEALNSFKHAVSLNHEFSKAHNNLGNAHRRKNDVEAAKASYRRAIEIDPNDADAHLSLGVLLRDLENEEDAERHIREAIRLNPRSHDGYNNLGIALARADKPHDAIHAYRHALRIAPNSPDTHNNLGIALGKLRRGSESVACYREALRLRPDYAEAHNNLGIALTEMEEHSQAIEHLEKALQLRPGYAAAHGNLGIALSEQGDADLALYNYEKALELAPDYAEGHMNRALSLLQQGRYEEGWDEYEWRWKCKDSKMPAFDQPLWEGQPIMGRTIVLHSEQGLGDTIQFIRYAQLVKERGAKVISLCPERLIPLLRLTPGVDTFHAKDTDAALPECHFHIPLMSLPRIFKTSLDNVPNSVPYVFPDPKLAHYWKSYLQAYPEVKIGINWQGNPHYRGDRHRSIPLLHFSALSGIEGVKFISVQQNYGIEQIDDMARVLPIVDLGGRLDREAGPFMDTAAILCNLDLMITSDTALAHLAGSLGVRTWLALPTACDWRWMREGDTSPWYPTLTIYRQKEMGNWGDVFERISHDLREFVASHPQHSAIRVEIAPGELIDKITILQIKLEQFTDSEKRRHVQHELSDLETARDCGVPPSKGLEDLTRSLRETNQELWDIEDRLRLLECAKDFGDEFISLARSVYQTNDQRASLKRQINLLLDSHIMEEKQYVEYRNSASESR